MHFSISEINEQLATSVCASVFLCPSPSLTCWKCHSPNDKCQRRTVANKVSSHELAALTDWMTIMSSIVFPLSSSDALGHQRKSRSVSSCAFSSTKVNLSTVTVRLRLCLCLRSFPLSSGRPALHSKCISMSTGRTRTAKLGCLLLVSIHVQHRQMTAVHQLQSVVCNKLRTCKWASLLN